MQTMDSAALRLGLSLVIGLIIGLERGWRSREEHGGRRLAGVRTFAIVSLSGGLASLLAQPDRAIILAAGFIVLGALVTVSYALTTRETRDFGLTTEVALLGTFTLGAAAVWGYPFEATASAVAMSLLLGLKPELHRAIRSLQRRELTATLQLLLIAAVVVPLLPNRYLGPWTAINPRLLGLLVLLIAGTSYVGYFAVRLLRPRLGIMLTAVFGGLTSSTAVTVAYARRARATGAYPRLFGVGIALAAATMVPRLAAEIFAVNARLLGVLWPTFVVLAGTPLVAAVLCARGGHAVEEDTRISVTNPLALPAALTFGALLAVFFVAVEGVRAWLGDSGVYLVAALAGVADVDAIGLSLAQAAGRSMTDVVAARAIVIAALVNTMVKGILAAAIGGRPMMRWASTTLALALGAAALVAFLTL